MKQQEFTSAGLDKIKVGDLVAPTRTTHSHVSGKTTTTWTGTLLRVTKVSEKRFCLGPSRWVAKDTGRSIGGGGSYVLATKDMIAEVERRDAARQNADQKTDAFRARPEHKYATNIWIILDEMNPDKHPLDRLTVDEWATFYNKLSGREPK